MTMLIENIRLSLNSLLANKSRAVLTMLGIIIGIASVIAIMTVGNSLTISVSSSMQSMGANNITVAVQKKEAQKDEKSNGITFGSVEKSREITEDDYFTDAMIISMQKDFPDTVEAISIDESIGSTTVKNGGNSVKASITGVSRGYFLANDMTILAGNILSAEEIENARNVVMVSDKFVEDYFGCSNQEAIGKVLSADVNNQTVEYNIVGVYEQQEDAFGSMMSGSSKEVKCFIPLTTAKKFVHSKNYESFSVVAKVGIDADDLASKIEAYMKGFYRSNQYYTVGAFSRASMVSTMSDMLSTITTAISIIAGIALLVGGIGVMNIMLVSITERTREIGTRKALGATNGSIRVQFIVESMIICLIGGAIGILLGIVLGTLGGSILGVASSPALSSILLSLCFSLAIGVFFGYYPANKAAKMNPIDALRYE